MLIALIILIVLIIFLEKIMKSVFGVEKKKISETPGKNFDRWGRGIILVLFLCPLPYIITLNTYVIKYYLILYLIVLFGFQSILEWKFLKDSKQYITTLVLLALTIIAFSLI